MDDDTVEQARVLWRSFATEMKAWETQAFAARETIGTDRELPIAEALFGICERFLTAKDRKFGRLFFRDGRPRCSSVGCPPEYDPERELIVGHEVKNRKTVVLTTEIVEPGGVKTQQRYQLVLDGVSFRIAKKEKLSAHKGKWVVLHM